MTRPGRESPGSVQEENHRDRLTGTDREEIQKGNIGKRMTEQKLYFECDYMKGAHPSILNRMVETNRMATIGYGVDEISESARAKIRKACGCENAMVQFLVGGTQTNAVVIDAFLRPWQGVIAAQTGHISVHEAGAIEAGGHKVLTLPSTRGKIFPEEVELYVKDFYQDANHEHMVMPGMVYLSQPTEYGTLYSREELVQFRRVCDKYHMALYIDGARLAYALACPENTVTLSDLAALCDAFYIGGTKCGALFGEAVVIPDPQRIPAFFTLVKQHGALLAKGRLLGIQFDTLFTDDLYMEIGKTAIEAAGRIQAALVRKGYRLWQESPTNQLFIIMENSKLEDFGRKVVYSFWEKYDDSHTVIRLVTDWGTTPEEIEALISIL